MRIRLNGAFVDIGEVDPDEPLLWVLREHLHLYGTKFGCGIGACGACTVHLDGAALPACQIAVGDVGEREVVTIEGLSPDRSHPVQAAWIAEQVAQCGYCQSGQIMRAAALLSANPAPSDADIIAAMDTCLCRCATYDRIARAVRRAAAG